MPLVKRGGNRNLHKPPSIRLMKLSNGRRLAGRKWLDSWAGEGRPKARCNITETWQESHKLPHLAPADTCHWELMAFIKQKERKL